MLFVAGVFIFFPTGDLLCNTEVRIQISIDRLKLSIKTASETERPEQDNVDSLEKKVTDDKCLSTVMLITTINKSKSG